jgi:energy-coupling factor transport system permease protein
MLSYVEKNTWIHSLSGVTKLIFFILWCLTSALTYDTRVLLVMIAIIVAVFAFSKTEWKQVSTVFKAVMFFMILNVVFIFIFSPYQGCEIYGSKTVLFHIAGNYDMTSEQLFYLFNVVIKYFTIIPSVFMFLVTTDPSEFAASMNQIGISYKFAYSIAIALRYVPDVQEDYHRIKNAQEARGIEMSSKAKLSERIKNISAIIFPLLFSSMQRIDVVSRAMELRGFGKHKKRTWYSARALHPLDYLVILFSVAFLAFSLYMTWKNGSRFYNPFMHA